MVASVVLVAIYGVQKVGGIAEVWHRSVAGGRITVPEYEFYTLQFRVNAKLLLILFLLSFFNLVSALI